MQVQVKYKAVIYEMTESKSCAGYPLRYADYEKTRDEHINR